MLNVRGVKDVRAPKNCRGRNKIRIPLIFGFDVIHGIKL
jgi:hypothetical protein